MIKVRWKLDTLRERGEKKDKVPNFQSIKLIDQSINQSIQNPIIYDL
jgi:hypothetical protein